MVGVVIVPFWVEQRRTLKVNSLLTFFRVMSQQMAPDRQCDDARTCPGVFCEDVVECRRERRCSRREEESVVCARWKDVGECVCGLPLVMVLR